MKFTWYWRDDGTLLIVQWQGETLVTMFMLSHDDIARMAAAWDGMYHGTRANPYRREAA